MWTILFMFLGYLAGSISSAILICRWLKLPDPRTEGSKNPGATNVLRFGGKKAAALVLIGDIAKGLIPVLIVRLLGFHDIAGWVAYATFLGHVFPVFFQFKGGKGVATALGALFGCSPPLAIALALIWFLVARYTHYSSLAALCAALMAPVFTLYFSNSSYFLPILGIVLVLIWRHHTNIVRLMMGTEPKIQMKVATDQSNPNEDNDQRG